MIVQKNGTIDRTSLEVEDIIDINTLQKFLDNFALGMNCAAVAVNRKGEEITKPSYYRQFCSNYIHKTALGDKRCAECHNQMGEEAVRNGSTFTGTCHAGLIDFSAPIIIQGEHIGTVLGGQILDKEPVEKQIRTVANELNISENELWESAKKIDIVDRKNIEASAEVLSIVVNTLAQDGYKRLETQMVTKELVENFIQISQTVEMLAESAQNITYNQHTLSDKITKINTVTNEITEVLRSISRVADKTKLIGLNASIEAARLGNDGRGFSVVAKEIQNLSEHSKKTAMQVNELNAQISSNITDTMGDAKRTLEVTEDQSAAMEELSATVQNSVELAEQLKELFQI
ncbi:MAG: PocR ligand-binding domain-containing protein [Velocimicrobium sp.]